MKAACDDAIGRLSFVATRAKPKKRQAPRCFWHVKPLGDYLTDERLGYRLALEYLSYEEAQRGGPGTLPLIVRDMPRELTVIEIGFLTLVSYAARAGAHEARRVAAYWDRCSAEREK